MALTMWLPEHLNRESSRYTSLPQLFGKVHLCRADAVNDFWGEQGSQLVLGRWGIFTRASGVLLEAVAAAAYLVLTVALGG